MLHVQNIQWIGDAGQGHLRLLDQTRLPAETIYLECRTVQDLWGAIKRLSVRGAPAIGIAAAYGCVLGAQSDQFDEAADRLATSRPTAINLFWAINRMKAVQPHTLQMLLAEAKAIHDQDAAMCQKIGEHAMTLIRASIERAPGVLTHCNAGALATGGIGTATAPMYLAHEHGLSFTVYADETRPLLQGSRLTAYELAAAGIAVTLICDDVAAQVMREGKIGMIITGADRIATNGDTANKIGTYSLAVLAKHHAIPFYVAAPSSTFDSSTASGDKIPIEQRGADEITHGFRTRTAPADIKTYSPAFDVTPHGLINAIITEKGIIEPVNSEGIQHVIE